MTDDQVRNKLWEAAYNVESFKRKKSNTTILSWFLRISLTIGTLAGFTSLMKDLPNGYASPLNIIGLSCGAFGTAILPLFNLQRSHEIFSEWIQEWIEIRNAYKDLLEEIRNERKKPPLSRMTKIDKQVADIEKDSRNAYMFSCKKNALKEIENWFKIHDY